MKKLEIKYTDIKEKKEFTFSNGERLLRQYGYNAEDGTWLYEKFLKLDGEWKLVCYELIDPPRAKNPDGTIVHRYPCSEEWGKNGWDIPKFKKGQEKEKAAFLNKFKPVK